MSVLLSTLTVVSTIDDAPAVSSFDQQLIGLVNAHRASIGRAQLVGSPSLSQDSLAWSQVMLATGVPGHDPNLPIGIGENVAASFGPPGVNLAVSWSTAGGPLPSYCTNSMDYTSPEFIVCGWLSSAAGHREAIESVAFRQVGAGSAFGPDPFGRATFSTMRFSTEAPNLAPTFCEGLAVTINMNVNGGNGMGTSGDDVILGSPGDDTINGLAGNDTICAGDGDDTVFSGAGNDRVFGEAGDDTIYGSTGNDFLNGGADDDEILGQGGVDSLFGLDGNDTLRGLGANDFLFGGLGDDRLFGNGGVDQIRGGPGLDQIWGGNLGDFLYGEGTRDIIRGGGGVDTIDGGAGNDDLFGEANTDTLVGGAGTDNFDGGGGADTCTDVAAGESVTSC